MTGPLCGLPHYDHPDTVCTEPAGHYVRDRDPHAGPLILNGRHCGGCAWDEPKEQHMTRRKTSRRISGDPRKSGGDIAGPGGPHDRNAVVLDTTDAVLLDSSDVCLVETSSGSVILAMLLEGRINKTTERARNLYLLNEDGAAALVTELLALANRISPEFGERFTDRIRHLIDTNAFTGSLQEDGHA